MASKCITVPLSNIDSLWTSLFGKTENIDWITARDKFHTYLEVPYVDLRGLKKFAVQAHELRKDIVLKIFTKFPKFYKKNPFPNEPIYEGIPSFEWICNLLNHRAFFGLQDYSNPNLKEGEFFVRLSNSYIVTFELRENGEIKRLGADLKDNTLQLSQTEKGTYLKDLIKNHGILSTRKPLSYQLFLDAKEKELFDVLLMKFGEEEINKSWKKFTGLGFETIETYRKHLRAEKKKYEKKPPVTETTPLSPPLPSSPEKYTGKPTDEKTEV